MGNDIHQAIIDVVSVVIMLLLCFGKVELSRWLASNGDQKDQAFLDGVLDYSAQAGLNIAQTRLNKPITIDLHNEAVNDAVKVALQLAAAEKAKLGYTDDDIAKAIVGRLDLSGPTVKIAGSTAAPIVVAAHS